MPIAGSAICRAELIPRTKLARTISRNGATMLPATSKYDDVSRMFLDRTRRRRDASPKSDRPIKCVFSIIEQNKNPRAGYKIPARGSDEMQQDSRQVDAQINTESFQSAHDELRRLNRIERRELKEFWDSFLCALCDLCGLIPHLISDLIYPPNTVQHANAISTGFAGFAGSKANLWDLIVQILQSCQNGVRSRGSASGSGAAAIYQVCGSTWRCGPLGWRIARPWSPRSRCL